MHKINVTNIVENHTSKNESSDDQAQTEFDFSSLDNSKPDSDNGKRQQRNFEQTAKY